VGGFHFANKIKGLQTPKDPETRPASMIPKLVLDVSGCEGLQDSTVETEAMLSTPVLLLHGTDDAWIDIALGQEVYQSLTELGMHVDWKEYSGAEHEGHWVKEPEGFDAIVRFLETTFRDTVGNDKPLSNNTYSVPAGIGNYH
jgi:alpha-beta hydrolase superfamily lysophospholipase